MNTIRHHTRSATLAAALIVLLLCSALFASNSRCPQPNSSVDPGLAPGPVILPETQLGVAEEQPPPTPVARAVSDPASELQITPDQQRAYKQLEILLAAEGTEGRAAPAPQTGEAIPWSQIGARAGADYRGDGLAITPAEHAARLRCVFQKLEGDAMPEGLWLTSNAV